MNAKNFVKDTRKGIQVKANITSLSQLSSLIDELKNIYYASGGTHKGGIYKDFVKRA